ncbi:MAG: S41 family peptidase [Planctomycetota bacterium]
MLAPRANERTAARGCKVFVEDCARDFGENIPTEFEIESLKNEFIEHTPTMTAAHTPRHGAPLRPTMHAIRLASAAAFIAAFAASCASTNPAATPLATPQPSALPTPAPVAAAPAPRKPIRPLETFDAAWTIVRDSYYDPRMKGIDWNAVRDELRPKAESAASVEELRGVLGEMLARLGESHFGIIPAEVANDDPTIHTASELAESPSGSAGIRADGAGSAASNAASASPSASPAPTAAEARGPGISGVDIALIEGKPTVLRVAPGSGGARAGVLTGWTLVEIDGVRLEPMLERMQQRLERETDPNSQRARQLAAATASIGDQMLVRNAGATAPAVFADASGAEQKVEIAFSAPELGATKFGNLPALPVEVSSRIIEVPVEGGAPARIGVLAFNIWMTGASEAIDKAVDGVRGCDGIVIDLRGNPGGVGAMSMGLAGYFLPEPASLGTMISRDGTIDFMVTPRKVSSAGKRVRTISRPLAIVQDIRSGSTSEIFAAGLQELGRARVFGETSAGQALPSMAVELPNGDILQHAMADFVTPKGTRVEGRGVVPDQAVVPTRAELLAGRDPAVDAAAAWIAGETKTRRASRPAPTATPAAPAAVN